MEGKKRKENYRKRETVLSVTGWLSEIAPLLNLNILTGCILAPIP